MEDKPVGGGLFCGDGYVVTCAHVVSRTGQPPAGPVYVEFQNADEHDPIPARVIEDGWVPESAGDGGLRGDVAVLRLDGEVPAGGEPPPLRASPVGMTVSHEFHTYGYPAEHAIGGVPARGRIVGSAGAEWLAIEGREVGQGADGGFSGSPVWDVQLAGVVGIIAIKDDPPPADDGGPLTDPRTAYAITTEALAKYWPWLRDKITAGPAARVDELLEVGPGDDGRLPRVADVNVYQLGVTPSMYGSVQSSDPGYAPRTWVDAKMEELFADGTRFIVAIGDSKSGKSRSMAQALHEHKGQARFIVPVRESAGLRRLAEFPAQLHRLLGDDEGLLWLDDIDEYLKPQGLDPNILAAFLDREPAITVVGTITSKKYNDLKNAREGGTRPGRQVLSQATRVPVDSKLSPEDQAAAQRLYPEEDFSKRGIGEVLVAAPRVEEQYTADREERPEVWAVVQAAIDWGRIGLPGPVPAARLLSLFPAYLDQVAPHLEATEELFGAAIELALDPLVRTIALLTRASTAPALPAYRAFGYLLARADGQGAEPVPIARAAWDEAVATADDEELLLIANEAMVRGEAAVVGQAADAVLQRPADPAARAFAALIRGELYAIGGDLDSAIGLLEAAAAAGSADVVPIARVELGALLAERDGEQERGLALLESETDAADPQVRAQAQVNLGVLLMKRGDTQAARPLLQAGLGGPINVVVGLARDHFLGLAPLSERPRALRKDIAADVGTTAAARPETDPAAGGLWNKKLRATLQARAESIQALALANLGGLLVTEGDLERARVLLEAAVSSGNPAVEPLAQANLGILLARHGDVEAAEKHFKRALLGSDPAVVAQAKISLGSLLADQGDFERGRVLLTEVADSGNADLAPRALCVLGERLMQRDELVLARSFLERAVRSGHREWSTYAAIGLGGIAARENDLDAARTQLEAAITAGHPEYSGQAATVLGELLQEAGLLDEAVTSFRTAIDLGHPTWAGAASIDLAVLRASQGALDEATDLLRVFIDGADRTVAAAAGCVLGDLRQEVGDVDEARAAYERAIGFEDSQWSAVGRFSLAHLLAAHDDQSGAEELLLEIATGSPTPAISAQAWDELGDLRNGGGDVAGAQDAYQHAIDANVEEWSAMARADLALLLLNANDDTEGARPLLTEAAASGSPVVVSFAHLILGLIVLSEEDPEGALALFRQSAEEGPPQLAARALLALGEVHEDAGEPQEAAAAYRRIIDENAADGDVLQEAAAHLGAILLHAGDTEEALSLLNQATSAENPDVAASACLAEGTYLFLNDHLGEAAEVLTLGLRTPSGLTTSLQTQLGIVRLAQDRLTEARELLQAALDSGDEEEDPRVRRYLGTVLAQQGHRGEARTVLLPLAESEETEHRPASLLMLGRMAAHQGNGGAARRWFADAIEGGDPEVEQIARRELAEILFDSGDIAGARRVQELPDISSQAPITISGPPDPLSLEAPVRKATAPEAPVPQALVPQVPAPAALVPEVARVVLPPLPIALLAGIAELAEIEGDPIEGAYWRGLLSDS